ncbi:MAG: hypothetical protein KAH18_12290 [Psychromonas sp.]|nr:hypothetical protein [Psychromonas sp.]
MSMKSRFQKFRNMITTRLVTKHTVPEEEIDRSVPEEATTLNIVFDREIGDGEFTSTEKISLATTVRACINQISTARFAANNDFEGYAKHIKVWFGRPTPKNIATLKKIVMEMHDALSDNTKFISFIKIVKPQPKELHFGNYDDNSGSCRYNRIDRGYRNTIKIVNNLPRGMDHTLHRNQGFPRTDSGFFDNENDNDNDIYSVNQPQPYMGNWDPYTEGREDYSRNHTDIHGGYQIYVGENMFNPSATKFDCSQIIFHQMACELFNASDDEHELGIGASPYAREQCMDFAMKDPQRSTEHSGCVGLFLASLGRPLANSDLIHSKTLRDMDYAFGAIADAGPGRSRLFTLGNKPTKVDPLDVVPKLRKLWD